MMKMYATIKIGDKTWQSEIDKDNLIKNNKGMFDLKFVDGRRFLVSPDNVVFHFEREDR